MAQKGTSLKMVATRSRVSERYWAKSSGGAEHLMDAGQSRRHQRADGPMLFRFLQARFGGALALERAR